MSGTWRRVAVARICGGCGAEVAAEAPGFEVRVPGVRRALLRCPACAPEPVPAALPPPAPTPRAPVALPFARFTVDQAADWKARASGAREPGQDG